MTLSRADRDGMLRAHQRIKLLKPSAWKEKAEELIAVAELLQPAIDEHSGTPPFHALNAAYLMLVSFAIENLLKGALVARNRDRYKEFMLRTPERRFPLELRSHDLLDLGRRLGLVFSKEETRLVKRLSHAATWSGKYPVPLRFSEFPIGDDSFVFGEAMPDDSFEIHKLFGRLEEELDLEDPPGADFL